MIYEPMTFFTDLLLAALALYCGVRTSELYWQEFHLFHFHLSWAFYTLALGALFGGIAHGFGPHFPPFWSDLVWRCTLVLIGIMTMFFLLATFAAVVPYPTYEVIRWIPILAVVIYAGVIWRSSDFGRVVRFYVPSMLFVLIVMIYLYVHTSNPGAGKIVLGLVISLLGAVVQQSGFAIHEQLNHNDIYHIIQMVGVWFIYIGGKSIKDLNS